MRRSSFTPLSLRRRTCSGDDATQMVEPDKRAFPTCSARLDVNGDPLATQLAVPFASAFSLTQTHIVRHGAHGRQQRRVIARVQTLACRRLVRKLPGGDQVLEADVDWIHAGRTRSRIGEPLHKHCRFGPSGPPVDVHGCVRGHVTAHGNIDVLNEIGTGKNTAGVAGRNLR